MLSQIVPGQIAEVPPSCHRACVGKGDVDGDLKRTENEERPSNPLKLNVWPRKSVVGSDSGLSPLIPFSLQGLLCKCDVNDSRPIQSYPMAFVISLRF